MSIPPISNSTDWAVPGKVILEQMPTRTEAEAQREFEDMKLREVISRIDGLSENKKEQKQRLKDGFFACYLENVSSINRKEQRGIEIQGKRQVSFEEFKATVKPNEQTGASASVAEPLIKKVPKELLITEKSKIKKKTSNLA